MDAIFGETVTLVDRTDATVDSDASADAEPDSPAGHALAALTGAIEDAGGEVETAPYWTATDAERYLVAGTTESRVVSRLLDADPADPEAVVYEWADTGDGIALVVAGTDRRGLAYALYELAERVEARGVAALSTVEEGVETPDNEVRGVDRYIETPVEDDWLYDDGFWEYYLERLARSRFNRFVLIAGFDTAFMSPPYPFLVDVPGYPDVSLTDSGGVSQETNRERLRWIARRCREYGLDFFFGIWQQQPWTDYQGELVAGLPEGDGLADYCAAGLREVLVECPEIDGVQLRVNFESGVGDRSTAEAFWNELVDAVADAEADHGRDVSLDLRAKGLTDGMIDHALEAGFDLTVPTKFWCESTGLPYHNTRMRRGELDNIDDRNRSRRYSYDDMLEKPRQFDLLYRLWASGTNRIFLWGDPDYARRFSKAAEFGGGVGFEVVAPLSLKGGYHGLRDEGWPLFDDPDLRDYEWEDERYWAWYRLFGRLGYSREADPDAWEREFDARFGAASEAIRRGYRAASKILPLHTAAHLTDHPLLHNWAELDTGGALFAENNYNDRFGETTYDTAEPSDPGLFYAIDEFVRDDLAGERQGKYTPRQVAEWYVHLAERTRAAADAAADAGVDTSDAPDDDADDTPDSGEFRATLLDLRMLADLAEYHAHKTVAALCLRRYRETDDPAHLPDARAAAAAMRESWAALADRGDGAYHDDLVFAAGPPSADEGTWRDRLVELDADIDDLESLCAEHGVDSEAGEWPSFGGDSFGPFPHVPFRVDAPDTAPPGSDVPVSVRAGELDGAETVRLHYRRANQRDGAFRTVEMERTDRGYRAAVPGEYVDPEYDLLAYVSATDPDGDTAIAPGLFHPDHAAPYVVIETRRS